MTREIKCDMRDDCDNPVTMIEDSGFAYCAEHGLNRRSYGERVRKMRPYELRRLANGLQLAHY